MVAVCLTATGANAQKADIEVAYTAHSVNLRDGESDITNQYILLANANRSKFFSPRTEYIDSLNSTPEGKARYNEMKKSAFLGGKINDVPRQDGKYYVEKLLAENIIRCYDASAVIDKYVYDEPLLPFDWTITDNTKEILGYECIGAETDFHGRKWTVWFSPEIPVNNGPWKLQGLPGLIMEATDGSGRYRFEATGIQQTHKEITPVYLSDEYEKTTRIDFLKALRSFLDNPLGKINARYSGSIVIKNEDGKTDGQVYVPASVADLIETDYH